MGASFSDMSDQLRKDIDMLPIDGDEYFRRIDQEEEEQKLGNTLSVGVNTSSDHTSSEHTSSHEVSNHEISPTVTYDKIPMTLDNGVEHVDKDTPIMKSKHFTEREYRNAYRSNNNILPNGDILIYPGSWFQYATNYTGIRYNEKLPKNVQDLKVLYVPESQIVTDTGTHFRYRAVKPPKTIQNVFDSIELIRGSNFDGIEKWNNFVIRGNILLFSIDGVPNKRKLTFKSDTKDEKDKKDDQNSKNMIHKNIMRVTSKAVPLPNSLKHNYIKIPVYNFKFHNGKQLDFVKTIPRPENMLELKLQILKLIHQPIDPLFRFYILKKSDVEFDHVYQYRDMYRDYNIMGNVYHYQDVVEFELHRESDIKR